MRLQWWGGPALFFCALVPAPAFAQSPSAPAPAPEATKTAASGVVLPHVKTQPETAYPEQARKDGVRGVVTVGLTIEIDAEGKVRKATVDAPQGHGFDEAAVAAAEKSTFEPARRGGVAFAAKVRFAVVFHPPDDAGAREPAPNKAPPGTIESPPNKAPPGAPESAPNKAPPGASAPLQRVVDVEVRGERELRDVTKRTLTMQEIALVPGTTGDALQSLQSLPGVARPPIVSTGQLIVRGSAPGDTNYMVDGTPVPIVYHFGGLASVLPTEVLHKIDFYPGNYSGAFGRGMGGLVDVGIRSPKSDGPHAMAQVDLLDMRALAEAPVFKTGWNVFLAARRSWYDIWLAPILEAANGGTTAASRYYDYQAMLQKDLSPRSSLRLLFFGSDDDLKLLNEDENAGATDLGGYAYHQSFWRLQVRYEDRLSDRTEIRAVLAGGQDSTDSDVESGDYKSSFHIKEAPVSARIELTQKVRPGVIANVGFDVVAGPYDANIVTPSLDGTGSPSGIPGQSTKETNRSGFRALAASYTEWELRLWRGMRIVPAIRVDYSSSTKTWDASPRLVARQDVTRAFPRTTVKGGVGLFYQPPASLEADPVFGQLGLKCNRSIHTDFGLEQELTRQIELSLDVYYKKLDDLVVQDGKNAGQGVAYGAEWLLRYKPDERFFGWIAYTISRSERQPSPTSRSAVTSYDQTHSLVVLGSYQLPYGFRVGLRLRLVSGNPYTPVSAGLYSATVGYQTPVVGYPYNSARLPLFNQLDLRVDKKFQWKSWALSGYLDIQNVYNQQNVEGIIHNYNYTQQASVYGLPFVPSFGLRGEL